MEMQEDPNQLPIIEIKPEDVILEEVKAEVKNMEETKYPIEITPEYDEDKMSIKPEFQCHVAVNENENIEIKPDSSNHVESILEQQGPAAIQKYMETEEDYQQAEVKTEYEFITVNVEEAIEGDQVNNGNIMEYNNEVSYQVCNISRFPKNVCPCKVKGTHTVYFSSSFFILNKKPVIPRSDFHCTTPWIACSSG